MRMFTMPRRRARRRQIRQRDPKLEALIGISVVIAVCKYI